MTEDEWLLSTDARAMDRYILRLQKSRSGGPLGEPRERQGKVASDRKWQLVTSEFSRQFSEQTRWRELQRSFEIALRAGDQFLLQRQFEEVNSFVDEVANALFAPLGATFPAAGTAEEVETVGHDFGALRRARCNLLREIFGNPFRPVAFDPAWHTSDVLLLARGIYDEHAFDRLPILADALQDAGCDCDDLLTHLRETAAPHVRGCWALDLVLGKE